MHNQQGKPSLRLLRDHFLIQTKIEPKPKLTIIVTISVTIFVTKIDHFRDQHFLIHFRDHFLIQTKVETWRVYLLYVTQ